ncbi:hydrogenase maturation nickel metallochaperone HypA [Candidatus Bathyarchaeota archaeon]|nr:MAG: hydrogenase maturation nickel metallochaperone HypA [Candidatus Bathyarchaeota archaeon]
MHEYSVTTQIVSKVLREAESRRAKRVLEVKLQIGELTFLNPEQVKFWYKALVKGTVMEGSKLIIQEKRGLVRCLKCGYEGSFKYEDDPAYHIAFPTLLCPKCGGVVEIIGGRECIIENIKMVV